MENEHEPARTPPVVSSPDEPVPQEPVAEPAPPASRARELGLGFWAGLAALLFFVSYSIAFIVGNDRKIHVDFVFATANVSLIWTILLLLVVGLVGGLLLSRLYRHHRSKQPGQP